MGVDEYFKLLYPNFETLSPDEQRDAMEDKKVIAQEILKINFRFQERHVGEKNSQYFMRKIFNEVLSEKYFLLLHPDYINEAQKNWKSINRHESFIEENLEQIDKKFKEVVREREEKGEKVNKAQIMTVVFNEVRTDKYFSMLYPNFEELSPDEQEKALLDKKYIFYHLEELEEKMERLKFGRYESKDLNRNIKRMRKVFNEVLLDDYINLLFFGSEEMSEKEIGEVEKDEEIVNENLEEIHREFQTRTNQPGKSYEEQERHEILKDVIDTIRNEKEKDNKQDIVTPSAIADISKKEEITSSQIKEAARVTEPEKEPKRR